jgi:hypothetical protein
LWGFEADIFSSNTGQCDISNVRQDVTFQLWQDIGKNQVLTCCTISLILRLAKEY